MVNVFAYGLAGATEGLGNGIVAQAEAKRIAALELARNQREDKQRAEDRKNDLADRDEDRAYTTGQTDAFNTRNADALRGAVNEDDLFSLMDGVEGEVGGNYDTLYGHAQRDGNKYAGTQVTGMTLDELDQFAGLNSEYGKWVKANNPKGDFATPVGRYQIVGTTRRYVAKALGLSGDTVFTKDVQDQMARYLATEALKGKAPGEESRKALAGVWDGFNTGKVSPDAFDRAIENFRNGVTPRQVSEADALVLADDKTPANVKAALEKQYGINGALDGNLSGEEWIPNPDGSATQVRMGTVKGSREMVPYLVNGKPVTRPTEARDVKLSASFVNTIKGRFKNEYGDVDQDSIDAFTGEVVRLMETYPTMTEIQAQNDALGRMDFEVTVLDDGQNWVFADTDPVTEKGDWKKTFLPRENEKPTIQPTGGETVSPPTADAATQSPTATTANSGAALQQARDAIAAGASREAVVARLIENGIDPKGL
jgi:hypothetical protein